MQRTRRFADNNTNYMVTRLSAELYIKQLLIRRIRLMFNIKKTSAMSAVAIKSPGIHIYINN